MEKLNYTKENYEATKTNLEKANYMNKLAKLEGLAHEEASQEDLDKLAAKLMHEAYLKMKKVKEIQEYINAKYLN